MELARQRRGQVEAEAVDVALEDEVAERVHDQPQHRRMHRVERVPRARVVHVVPRVAGNGPVVGEVVDALEGEHRAEVVPLRRVVVDDVEDHLDPGAVERLDHPLELLHLLAVPAGGRVERVRREVADRAVAPVVGQPLPGKRHLVCDVVDREQLDRGDAERGEVLERLLRGEPGIRAAQLLRHLLHQLGEAAHVQLVDDGLVPRARRRAVVLPVERLVDHDRLRESPRRRPRRPARGRRRRRPARRGGHCRLPQLTGPSIDFAYGSIRSLSGLKRWPCSGAQGPWTR